MARKDYTRLRKHIADLRITHQSLAKAMGFSPGYFSQKMHDVYPFKEHEIRRLCWLLNIPEEERDAYFTCYEVEETQSSEQHEADFCPAAAASADSVAVSL